MNRKLNYENRHRADGLCLKCQRPTGRHSTILCSRAATRTMWRGLMTALLF